MQKKEEIIEQSLELLKKAIEEGVSNYRIAKNTKITERTIGNYVNGATKPTYANASILIRYFEGEMLKKPNDANSIIASGDGSVAGNIGGNVQTYGRGSNIGSNIAADGGIEYSPIGSKLRELENTVELKDKEIELLKRRISELEKDKDNLMKLLLK